MYASQEQSHTFSNLSNDNYLLIISGNGTSCFYSNNVTVNSDQKFNVTTSTTGSTCGSENGIVTINVGNGYSGTIDYTITGPSSLPPIIDTTLSSNTFNNLSEGEYTVTITDQQGCQVSKSFIITTTGTLISSVNTTSCVNGNDGQAQVMIFGGNPTFTYEWSSNVPTSQTGSTVNGLSGGSYSVKVTDSNGCSNTHNFNISCLNQLIGGYEVINICNDNFTTTTANKRGFDEMLNEGFIDITSGYTNCVFTSATFTCNVSINGSAYTQNFYTTNSLNNYPQDTLWISTIENILSTITEIGSYNLDPVTNQIKIKSKCDGDMDALNNSLVSISLTINYGVYCLYDSYKQFQDLTYFEFMTGIPYEFQ